MSCYKKNRERLRHDSEMTNLRSSLALAQYVANVNKMAMDVMALKWESKIDELQVDESLDAFEKAMKDGNAVSQAAARAALRNAVIGDRCTVPHQLVLVTKLMTTAVTTPEGLLVNEAQMRDLSASIIELSRAGASVPWQPSTEKLDPQ